MNNPHSKIKGDITPEGLACLLFILILCCGGC
jgi:hypothetical protein